MKTQIMYTKQGQVVHVQKKVEGGYLGQYIMMFFGNEGDEWEEPGGELIFFESLLEVSPKIKLAEGLDALRKEEKSIIETMIELQKEKRKLDNEIKKASETIINSKKFIINKTEIINAKTIAFFPENSVMPTTLKSDDKDFRGLKITFEISIGPYDKDRSWGYKMYFDQGYNSGDYLCRKYGVLINPTEEQIDETIKKRLAEFKFSEYVIARVDDKYLTPELLLIKNTYNENERVKSEKNISDNILRLETELSNLRNKSDSPGK